MNNSIYVFGSLENGFTQYPNDYTENVFVKMYELARSKSQIVIHRDGSLMYYGYIRKLDIKSQYIGLCVLLNDAMFTNLNSLFTIFENAVADMVARGEILQFNDNGEISSNTGYLHGKQHEVERVIAAVKNDVFTNNTASKKLPPIQYDIAKTSVKNFSIDQRIEEIVDASYKYGYTCVFKEKNFNTTGINSYQNVLKRIKKENVEIKKQYEEQKKLNTKLENKQKNTLLVGVLSVVIAILAVILYFTVINPSEVTHYETNEFVYYGPLKNKKPHGVGVAIYPDNDAAGRKFYIGNFEEGKRHDENAMLLYQDGDYYYGSMDDDKWKQGMIYMNSDNSHFVGTFKDNEPFTGTWYDHQELYELEQGKRINRK